MQTFLVCPLNYETPMHRLAVTMAAQGTDELANQVTAELYRWFLNAIAIALGRSR
ncbi:hypothetical protein NDI49_02385 [Trichocoleus sp. ST-U3]|uniref:hypothetical protein n=1 Tax=Coleofasciculus sp. FACHB-542 TaxID=2692787 RepID=UPI001689F4EB|nr:hypothetical protein [Coleofasciculus sp. FACHB-542]MBD2087825.1 hypothetical protein [Coleofasciculus sp. FACHB-542]